MAVTVTVICAPEKKSMVSLTEGPEADTTGDKATLHVGGL
jgi:hypothetical protein